MKRVFSLFVLGIFFVSMMGIVSAGPLSDIGTFFDDIAKNLDESKFFPALLGETPEGDLLFAKVLFLIIVFSIVWASLNKVDFFNETTWVLWLVSVAASVLAIRWIDEGSLVETILLPYSAFGVAITAGLPFVLYFFVVMNFKKTIRKLSWVFFAVIFIGLWFSRSGEKGVGNFAYIYLVTAILGLMVLSFDGTIQKIKAKIKSDKARAYGREKLIGELMDNIGLIESRFANGTITETDYKRQLKEEHVKLTALRKKL